MKLPFCRNCGKEYANPNAQFCPSCGKPIQGTMAAAVGPAPQVAQVKYCQKCGASNDASAVACKNCGNKTFDAIPSIKVTRPTGVLVLTVLQLVIGLVLVGVGVAVGGLGVYLAGIGGLLFLVALSLFTGRNWARILMLVISVLAIFGGDLLSFVVLWYFRKPNVVAYFKQPK